MFKTVALLFFAAGLPLAAQWINYPDSRIPRNPDGSPDLTAPAPMLDSKPDLTGLWEAERTPISEFESVLGAGASNLQVDFSDINKYVVNVFWGIPPEDAPLKPAAAEIMQQRQASGALATQTRCLPSSIPFGLFTFTFKFVQAPDEIIMLPEVADPPRQIFTDGRALPEDPNPSWMGYSVGHWEDDTLVVETTGLNDRGWLDGMGHPRSESMHITERYHRRDVGHMDIEITFDDPEYYTRPFTIQTYANLLPDSDLFEYVCTENERDQDHMGN